MEKLYLTQIEFNSLPLNQYYDYMEVSIKETGEVYRLEPINKTIITKNYQLDWHWIKDKGKKDNIKALKIAMIGL